MNAAFDSRLGADRIKGIAAMLFTAVLWSTSGLVIKLVDWNPIAITGSRSLIAALLLIAVTRRFRLPKSKTAWASVVSYTLTMLTFVVANKLTTSANAIFLQYLAPAFVAVFGIYLLKEKLRLLDWLILLGVMCGMVLFFLDRIGPGETAGNIISVVSGLFLALFIVFMRLEAVRSGGGDSRPIDHMICGHLLAACISVPFVIASSPPDLGSLAGVAFMGLVQIGVSSLFFAYGVARITAFSTSIITLLEPVLNPVWVYLIIGELPSGLAIVGGAVIVVLVTLRSLLAARGQASESKP
jgi:drug/metabolite transporter (DMT)-like permease